MRIAIIGVKGYPIVYGGFDTFIRELSERLVQKGIHVTVYCHRSLFKGRPKNVNGIDLVYMPAIESKSLSQLSHSFLSFIHAGFSNADIVFAVNTANGPFGLITKFLRKPSIINVDGVEWERPKWKGFGSKYFYWSSKTATRFFDQLVADADAMRQVYLSEFGTDSKVISYGANIRYSNNPSLIQRWNLKPNDYYLIVGRLIPDNNADLIIDGFLSTSSSKKLVIVGDVSYRDEFADRIKSIDDERLIKTGYVKNQDELAELYHNAYAYLHGHEYGGTNPTILKALAYGSAILALDTVFNREVLKDERHGVLFKKAATSVAEKINQLENNPTIVKELKLNARTGITDKYDWDQICDQYIDCFEQLLKAKN